MFEPCDVVERRRHSNGITPSLACILTKQHGVRGGKFLLKTPGNAISETLNLKMSLDALALKDLCLWCQFQSCLLFIVSLLPKNFLTALNLHPSLDNNCKDRNSIWWKKNVCNSFYTMWWMPRTMWLVVAYDLLEYRHLIDIITNLSSLCCLTWHMVLKKFAIKQVNVSKKV